MFESNNEKLKSDITAIKNKEDENAALKEALKAKNDLIEILRNNMKANK